MNRNTRALRLALLLAIGCFGGLILVTNQENGHRSSDASSTIAYGLDLEMKWVATDAQSRFAEVQDTLHHYMAAFGGNGNALSSTFKLDHCCEDAALRAAWTGNADFYQLSFSADFLQPGARQDLVAQMLDRGYLQVDRVQDWFGLFKGTASLSLPIPGDVGRRLTIRRSEFTLSFEPRVLDSQEEDPEA